MSTVLYIRIHSEDVLEVIYNSINEDIPRRKKMNILIASFNTTQARFKLYSYLEYLDEQVLSDTDVVVQKSKPGQASVDLRNYLGYMTSELDFNKISF